MSTECPGLVGPFHACPSILHGFTPAETEAVVNLAVALIGLTLIAGLFILVLLVVASID